MFQSAVTTALLRDRPADAAAECAADNALCNCTRFAAGSSSLIDAAAEEAALLCWVAFDGALSRFLFFEVDDDDEDEAEEEMEEEVEEVDASELLPAALALASSPSTIPPFTSGSRTITASRTAWVCLVSSDSGLTKGPDCASCLEMPRVSGERSHSLAVPSAEPDSSNGRTGDQEVTQTIAPLSTLLPFSCMRSC